MLHFLLFLHYLLELVSQSTQLQARCPPPLTLLLDLYAVIWMSTKGTVLLWESAQKKFLQCADLELLVDSLWLPFAEKTNLSNAAQCHFSFWFIGSRFQALSIVYPHNRKLTGLSVVKAFRNLDNASEITLVNIYILHSAVLKIYYPQQIWLYIATAFIVFYTQAIEAPMSEMTYLQILLIQYQP